MKPIFTNIIPNLLYREVGLEKMNKYDTLLSNTKIFAIATFSSKLMVFLLMPLYTRLLSPADYGIMDIIVQTANLIVPIAFISISEAVIRYGLDKNTKKSDVFTTGISTCFKGFLVLLLFLPLLKLYPTISDYIVLIYIYVISACLRAVCSQFTRGIGLVRLYAFDGVLATLTIIIFNIIFMVGLKMGVTGYVLSIILSNFISVLFLFISANLGKYLKFGQASKKLKREMYAYSLPLIPTTIFWWVMNVSDRYIVNYFLGEDITGLYSAAYKLPTIITLVSSIFAQAWQLSAVNEYETDDKDRFYSKIFGFLQAVIFTAASGIILLIKPLTIALVAKPYYPSWDYTPILVYAVVFSCFATFLGSFYMASKKNSMSLITTMMGAGLNIVLNMLFIPKMGGEGAAFATLISYFVVFITRAIDTRRFVKLKIDIPVLALNIIAMSLQVFASVISVERNYIVQILMTLFIIALNMKTLTYAFVSLIEMKNNKRKKK